MSTATVTSQIEVRQGSVLSAKALDYWQLAKPRIAIMAMFTVAIGYYLGCRGEFHVGQLLDACFGIVCVAVSCSFLNQWVERDVDRAMLRTADRPLPAGRISGREVLIVGVAAGLLGALWLAVNVNALTCVLSLVTLASYVSAYTPLKRVSFLCTQIGAVAGALPPILGWCAAGGELDEGALALFLLMFCWQFPHLLAIATIYREDYEAAGLKMLPLRQDGRSLAGEVGVAYACVLIPVSLMANAQGLVGGLALSCVLLGGFAYLVSAGRFWRESSVRRARELLLCSIVYLPTVLLSMAVDHYRLLA